MKRSAFTMVELIFVIVIIGILSAMAIPKFTGVKDQAKKATELSAASAVSAALEEIHGTWSTTDDQFDWNNDGISDPLSSLSYHGYPYALSRNGDAMGALFRSGNKSGFKEQGGLITKAGTNISYRLYTGKASDPTTGVKFPLEYAGKDLAGKPDKNDFWLYVVDANASSANSCTAKSSHGKEWSVMSGDFLLIDVNETLPVKFSEDGLGIGFSISCS